MIINPTAFGFLTPAAKAVYGGMARPARRRKRRATKKATRRAAPRRKAVARRGGGRLKKGSAAAKAYMAKIRRKRKR